MIPKRLFEYSDVARGNAPMDPAVSVGLRLVEQQFRQFLLAFQRIAFGAIANANKLENFDAFWCVHTFGGAANTDEAIPHKLGRVPSGIINIETPSFNGSAPIVGTVTFGSSAPTASVITVRCSAASKVATFIIF